MMPIVNLLPDHLHDSDLHYGDETVLQVLTEPAEWQREGAVSVRR
jgi:hypothetical protein